MLTRFRSSARTSRAPFSRNLDSKLSLRTYHRVPSARNRNNNAIAVAVGGTAVATVAFVYSRSNPIFNDSSLPVVESSSSKSSSRWPEQSKDHLETIAWGSNKSKVLSPSSQESETIRSPRKVEWLQDVALRDLALHEHHGACVDARGDVYQWGDGFYDRTRQDRSPTLSLSGKDIVSLQLTTTKLIALSSTGKIYVLPIDEKNQISSGNDSSRSSWSSWLFGDAGRGSYVQLETDSKLSRGEKFISISAGSDHLLALTSSGRTFAHPLSDQANAYGQLGIRKFDIPNSQTPSSRKQIELIPKAISNPFGNKTAYSRSSNPLTASALRVSDSTEAGQGTNTESNNSDEEFFSDKLFEIPSLKGIKVVQAAAGARSSYIRTAEGGRVLAWGANQYGQLGLGAAVTVDTITIPTEIVFTRSTPAGTRSRCVGICTGGDLAFFLVERSDGTFMPTTDVLACGMGQWGALGNGVFTTAQSTPSKVRAVSGLLEFSEQTQNRQAIVPHALSVSPTGHVLLTLDTLTRSGSSPGESGRDLFTWGKNHDYQLGTGNRTSLATPATLTTNLTPTSTEENSTTNRVMLLKRRADVRDLRGNVWRKKVEVEQCAVAGYSSSMMYWRICGF